MASMFLAQNIMIFKLLTYEHVVKVASLMILKLLAYKHEVKVASLMIFQISL